MSRFDKNVFVLRDEFFNPHTGITSGHVEEVNYGDLVREYAFQVITPNGLESLYHIRNENEIWTWGRYGNSPRKLEILSSKEEAEETLMEMFEYNLRKVEKKWGDTEEELIEQYIPKID